MSQGTGRVDVASSSDHYPDWQREVSVGKRQWLEGTDGCFGPRTPTRPLSPHHVRLGPQSQRHLHRCTVAATPAPWHSTVLVSNLLAQTLLRRHIGIYLYR